VTGGRSAGILLPLFSVRTERGWGIGEYPDLGALAPWLAEARASVWMLLPLNEAALGQSSPYSAASAFALDPIYVRLDDVPEFRQLGGEAALPPEDRDLLVALRGRATVDYPAVRDLKARWLRRAFAHFHESGAAAGGERARDLASFREEQQPWLDGYLLWRALKEERPDGSWRSWPEDVRTKRPPALADAGRRLAPSMRFFEYLQWQAFRQLAKGRRDAAAAGVRLAGDLPFLVAEDSADVWARQDEFRFDATVGVPPDAFSAEGQDWGLPVYRWDVIAGGGHAWNRERGIASARLYDLIRIDHVVGFYRTYARPLDQAQPHHFVPPDEPSQRRQGEAVMAAFRAGGVGLIAEDLGTVPPFVRESLTALGIPGYRVLRWEKDDHVFRDPARWPALSVATTGTHDSEPIAAWWDALDEHERRHLHDLPSLRGLDFGQTTRFGPPVHDALLEAVYGAGSNLLLLPIQDAFGLRDRINLPGTVSDENWSYRLPWTIGNLAREPVVRAATAKLADLAVRHRRVG
jgi:4-alpha-glucanotransferase